MSATNTDILIIGGGVRRQGRHHAEAKIAIEAIQRWKTLELELEADLRYRRGGNLLLAESDIEANQLSELVHKQHVMGFTDVQFVDRKEALSLVPGLNDRVEAGSYSPADGQADPILTTLAFAKAAQHRGAIYWTGINTSSLLSWICTCSSNWSLRSRSNQRIVNSRVR